MRAHRTLTRNDDAVANACPTCGAEIDPGATDTLDAVELASDTADRLVSFHEDCYPHASSRYRLL